MKGYQCLEKKHQTRGGKVRCRRHPEDRATGPDKQKGGEEAKRKTSEVKERSEAGVGAEARLEIEHTQGLERIEPAARSG